MTFHLKLNFTKLLLSNAGKRNLCSKIDPMSLYEPAFEVKPPEVPMYDLINLHFRGYDYAVIEKYHKYVYDICKLMNLDVNNTWPSPAQFTKVATFKPRTATVTEEFKYGWYERVVQVADLPTPSMPILVDVLRTNLPKGVEFVVKPHEPFDDEIRYIPEYEVIALKKQIDEVEEKKKRSIIV